MKRKHIPESLIAGIQKATGFSRAKILELIRSGRSVRINTLVELWIADRVQFFLETGAVRKANTMHRFEPEDKLRKTRRKETVANPKKEIVFWVWKTMSSRGKKLPIEEVYRILREDARHRWFREIKELYTLGKEDIVALIQGSGNSLFDL